jgi:molybdopterin-guanine dinucleotide biosynthesis protein A
MDRITGVILAGGKSRRMGTDKGLLSLNRKPFVAHICEALQPIVGDNIVIVSSNADYDFLGYPRIEDLIADKGPVGGIYTALKCSKTKLNIVLSVDSPLVSAELLLWMLENRNDSYMMTQLQAQEKTSPLIGIYDRSVNVIFEQHLASNQLKLRQVIKELRHETLTVPEKWSHQIQNINTPEEYQNLVS